MVAGSGTDQFLYGDNGADSLLTGAGIGQNLFAGSGNDTLVAGTGNDQYLIGGADADSLLGGNGDRQTLNGDSGNDTLVAGNGIDQYLLGGDGADSLLGRTAFWQLLTGGAGNDTLVATDGEQYLEGGDDDDSLLGGNGLGQQLSGDAGNDTLVAGTGSNQYLMGGDGADSLLGGDEIYGNLSGDAGDDTLVAGAGNEQILFGGDGADSLNAGNGDWQQLLGGAGNDTLVGGNGPNWASYGGAGGNVTVDLVNGSSSGDQGEDSLTSIEAVQGGAFDDSLLGDGANNTLNGLSGNDTLDGGTDADLTAYNNAIGSVTVDLVNGSTSGADGEDSLINIEAAQGGWFADSLLGNGANNTLAGSFGDDTLDGGAGADWASYDNSFYINANAGVDARLGEGTNAGVASGGGGEDRLYGIEGLIGSPFDDTLVGNSDVNTLMGSAGNDLLDFGAGDEIYRRGISETGNDTLIGGDGNDTLDLQANWSFLSMEGAYSLYQDNGDTIWAQGWEQVVCFAEGTRIVTPNGEDAVENLRAGDMVLAMRGGQAGFEALRWVGFMDVAVPRDAVMAAKTAPILIKAGALAPGMPARDLRVSPDHAMEVDGHLIPAKHLLNGSSIVQEVWCRRVGYFHLELEAHGLLLSEGTWSESYLDDGNRHAFNNAALTGLYLDFEAGRSKGQYDHQACLPMLRQGLKLDEIHGRIALRAQELAHEGKRRA